MSNVQDQDLEDGVSEFQDEAGASEDAGTPAAASSSDATDANQAEGDELLSVVRDVVGERKEEPAAASSADGEEDGQKAGDPQEQDNETYSDVPFNKHPRFQEVLGKLKTAETDAVRYRNVQTFLDEQGLGAEETAELLTIGGLMKRNPAEAWARMKPTVQRLLIAAGEVLPDDLKQRVQTGEMSREAAMEVNRSRAQVTSTQRHQSFEQQQAQRRQQVERETAVHGAASSWENDRRLKDPNFDAKLPALQREIAWLQSTEGKPDTAEGVKAQLKKAYEAVNAALPAASPPPSARRQPVAPVRSGPVAGNARPEPNSILDIVRASRRA